MANRDNPMGLRPAYHLTGGVIRQQVYSIASAYDTGIWSGDLVHVVSTSRNIEAGDGAGDAPFIGVFAGCEYSDTSGNKIFSRQWLASTATLGSVDAVAYVYDDPNIVWIIQADGALAVTDVWRQADLAYTAGSTVTGQSKTELDYSNLGTGKNFHVYGIYDHPENTAGSTNVDVLVLINEHSLVNGGATQYEEVT